MSGYAMLPTSSHEGSSAYAPSPSSSSSHRPSSPSSPSALVRARTALHARLANSPLSSALDSLKPRTLRLGAYALAALVLVSLAGLSLRSGTSGAADGGLRLESPLAGESARSQWGIYSSWADGWLGGSRAGAGGGAGGRSRPQNERLVDPPLEMDAKSGLLMPPEVYPAALNPCVPLSPPPTRTSLAVLTRSPSPSAQLQAGQCRLCRSRAQQRARGDAQLDAAPRVALQPAVQLPLGLPQRRAVRRRVQEGRPLNDEERGPLWCVEPALARRGGFQGGADERRSPAEVIAKEHWSYPSFINQTHAAEERQKMVDEHVIVRPSLPPSSEREVNPPRRPSQLTPSPLARSTAAASRTATCAASIRCSSSSSRSSRTLTGTGASR